MLEVRPLSLDGVFEIRPPRPGDHRGFFSEVWNQETWRAAGIDLMFVQDNHSYSAARGVLRGLHYQLSNPQGKLVHVARGSIFDVAVDIRRGSPSFGKWTGIELNDDNLLSLWIPPGFAHGFCVLSDTADVIYKCTTVYDARDDHGVAWNDSRIGIEWPATEAIVSGKDQQWDGLDAGRADLPRYE